MELLEGINSSRVREFIILGFPGFPNSHFFLFLVFFFVYLLTVSSNITIIALVLVDKHLHSPMYFFISNLSFLEIGYISSTVPNLMVSLLTRNNSISFGGCIAQLYFFSCLGATENLLLALMAYDRYLAICSPLRYTLVMSSKMCIRLATVSWSGGFFIVTVPIVFIALLSFCGPNVVDHFLCEAAPLLQLSCSDTSTAKALLSASATTATLTSVLFTMFSYSCILFSIFRIPLTSGRKKALSTCASHFIVVTLFYTSVCVMYMQPSGTHSSRNRIVAVFYGFVTPLLNPFIYSLRNKDIKHALIKILNRSKNISSQNIAMKIIFQ
ncbi:olfactory receptor 6B1-like [Pelobates fuscus]|uniref:olfactory receptor 6B1-like n=1 Tax=Pelobates fuscus TaxID=191477 RepID=UPI002FE45484